MDDTRTGDFARSYINENWHRTWRDWQDRQALVGFALVVLGFLGYGWIKSDPTMALVGLYVAAVYLAIRVFVLTPMAMWNDARTTIADLRDRARPRLHLVFAPDTLPFLQELTVQESDMVVRHRTWRVGIRNDSEAVIPNVRVVVESFAVIDGAEVLPAKPDQPALIEHALNVMGLDDKHGFVTVAPGDRPTAFVDVAGQWFTDDNPDGDWWSPCYASGHRTPLFARGLYMLGLRVEGGGTYSRARFTLGATLENRRIAMRAAG